MRRTRECDDTACTFLSGEKPDIHGCGGWLFGELVAGEVVQVRIFVPGLRDRLIEAQ